VTVNADTLIDELRLRRFARLAAPMLRGKALHGIGPRAARNRAGAGLEFLDLREYTPGEDVRNIDWRQTARRRRLLVRRYRDEAASDWLLCVDGSASVGQGRKWQLVVELTTALAYTLISAGHRASLVIFAERIYASCPPGRGQRQFAAITRQLADYRPAKFGGASIPGLCAGRATRSGNLILLSDFLREDAMADDLRLVRGGIASASAIQVLSDDDTTANTAGPAVLYDVESGTERHLDVSATTTATAADALDQHNLKLRDVCAALDVRFSTCSVGDSWEQVLLAHLGL